MKAAVATLLLLGLVACEPKPAPAPVESSSSTAATSVSALSPDEQGLTTPEAFLQALFAHYSHEFDDWHSSLFDGAMSAYFDPEMTALITEDRRLNEGYAPALDFDPICGCQDLYSLQATLTTRARTASTATIVAHIGKIDRTFELVSIEGKWRIHDISDAQIPSLRAFLTKANKDAEVADQASVSAGR